jgi:hypothetical protein
MAYRHGLTTILLGTALCLVATSLAAETYRWKDKDGKIHYGAAVPAEYADQPYDVLNDAGMVIDRVEDTSVPMDIREEVKEMVKERAPLISQEERERAYDRLLVIQYRSEDEIKQALEFELAQLGYDKTIIEQSYNSTTTAIRDQIHQAADRQRANQPVPAEQQQAIDRLYARLASENEKQLAMTRREDQIRQRFQKHLERYRVLISKDQQESEAQTDQG